MCAAVLGILVYGNVAERGAPETWVVDRGTSLPRHEMQFDKA